MNNKIKNVIKRPLKIFLNAIEKYINDEKKRYMIDYYTHYPLFYLSKNRRRAFTLEEPKDRAIHVFCTGPSIDETLKYIDDLPGDIMICNGLASLDFFKNNADVKYISALDEALLQYPLWKEVFDWWAYNRKDVSIITFPDHYDKWDSNIKNNLKCLINILNYKFYNFEKLGKKVIEHSKKGVVYCYGDSALSMLWSAVQLGYKEIYIHGMDYAKFDGIKVDKSNKVTVPFFKHSSYLNEWDRIEYKNMTEDPIGIERLRVSNENTNMKNYVSEMCRVYTNIYNIRYYADAVGAKIYNMSVNSYVDCFEKLDYTDILKMKGIN